MRGISILGSTGSIGKNTLRVIDRFPNKFRVIGLAAGNQFEEIRKQIVKYQPEIVSLKSKTSASELKREFPKLTVLSGQDGLIDIATHPDSEFVVSATVGAVGLTPTLSAIKHGKTVGLANKETLVMAGDLMTKTAVESSSQILPIDSEHNAIHQCLDGRKQTIRNIWLTASGGPFRNATVAEMNQVTPEQALQHPTWKMGPKITIDSATMMNKGLEIIEAHWLFNVRPEQIQVVVHPQSTVHSLVEFVDGSFLAQLGITDMRLPIQYALTYPDRIDTGLQSLNFATPVQLNFEPPDFTRFKCLRLAYDALREAGTAPAVLNAANEVAVTAFLNRQIGFLAIPEILEETLSRHKVKTADDLEAVLEADSWARAKADSLIKTSTVPG